MQTSMRLWNNVTRGDANKLAQFSCMHSCRICDSERYMHELRVQRNGNGNVNGRRPDQRIVISVHVARKARGQKLGSRQMRGRTRD